VDLQGPELRIGDLPAPVLLEEGSTVCLPDDIPVPRIVLNALSKGQEIMLDDGKLLLVITDPGQAVVKRGGLLHSRKSIALPGKELNTPALTEEDLENISHFTEFGVTGVMQPFVRSGKDLRILRDALDRTGCSALRIYAKIENQRGMDRLPEILPEADEIVIARGDLGNAMPLWELPAAQKKIAAFCRAVKKPFMVVTQMLASMEHSPVPTRAEVSDVFNAVLDGAASVMVTGETAVGEFPTNVVAYLASTVNAAQRYLMEL
jgi:pyruvate kinase